MSTVELHVDDREFVEWIRQVEGAIDRIVDEASEELKGAAESESRSASSRVAGSWGLEGSVGSEERELVSGEWWAHFIARGTRAHGPATAERLRFAFGGDMVWAEFVSGIPANPFHERAVSQTESRADEIIGRALAEVV